MTVDASQLQKIRRGLVVSCQAPVDSPLHDTAVIAAMAQAAVNQHASGIRVDTPAHVEAVRQRVSVPIIGLWKQQIPGSDVYITPQFHHAAAIAQAGADIIAIDATLRDRPGGETMPDLIAHIHRDLGKLVMADIDTMESAIAAVEAGVDLVGTTLYGYTADTKQFSPPGFDLLTQLVDTLNIPVICEGGIASPQMARQALDLGAYSVVVGTAITGIDLQVQAYNAALTQELPAVFIDHTSPYQFALFNTEHSSYRHYVRGKLVQYNTTSTAPEQFFEQTTLRGVPLEIFLLDDRQKVRAGLVGLTRWNWLLVEVLWVEESLRRQGFGSKLMQIAEQEAKQRGCNEAILDTFSFQAKGFYEQLGYEVFAQVDDYPSGYSFYQLKKML
jgi:N-acylglucosamine-6-phosphate 2-epimerase